ncbi:unnamed protein product [Caenorhabditis auriculariae]|uniref:DnaJ homolog subfamily C member 10 n=1 Tax=Caenorhabditis auriculariae TaxID=2777116 RepID=A0A8S1GSX5_9PELO|nr:unnamed protein product [Caenorhabditis auriculariae]
MDFRTQRERPLPLFSTHQFSNAYVFFIWAQVTMWSHLLLLACLAQLAHGEDYYKLLGVERDADDRTIRKAFKKLAIQKHPDKNTDDPNAHAEFVMINKAYEVLKDENLRKKYDQFGEKGLEDGFQGGNNYQSWQFYNDNFGIYDDDVEIVTLNRADFQRLVSDTSDVWFINFYSTYCSHCHELAPTWRKFARDIEGVVRIGAVNCAEDPMLCQSQRVNAYPSLVFYPTGEFYQGVREVELLVDYVVQRLKSEVLHLNKGNIADLSQYWEPYNERPWIIDFCSNEHDVDYEKLSAMLDGLVNVGTIDCSAEEELCADFEESSEGPFFFPKGKIEPEKRQALNTMDVQEIAKNVIKLLDPIQTMDTEQLDELINHTPDEPTAVWFVANEGQFSEFPEYRRIPALISNPIYSYDCSTSSTCSELLDTTKLPQFVVFKKTGGYEIDYVNHRDHHSVVAFLREAAMSPLMALDRDSYAEAVKGDELFIVDYFAPWCPPCLKMIGEYRRYHHQVAENEILSSIKIATLDCQKYRDLCTAAGVQSYPTSVLYTPAGKQHRLTGYHAMDALIDFLENAIDPAVTELTPDTFEELAMQRGEEETWIVDFFAPWCGPCQQLAPELQRAARALQDQDANIHVGTVDCQEYAAFCKQKLVAAYPTVRLFPAKTSKHARKSHYDYPNNMWRNSDSIQRWVFGMLPSSVEALGNDFWTTVLDADEPWVVDFYAPWCGHCVQFAPTYEKLAKKFNGRLKFAKVDCDQWPGVCQGAQVQAYPTIRLYRGRTNSKRQDVWGTQIRSHDEHGFAQFVQQQIGISHDEL